MCVYPLVSPILYMCVMCIPPSCFIHVCVVHPPSCDPRFIHVHDVHTPYCEPRFIHVCDVHPPSCEPRFIHVCDVHDGFYILRMYVIVEHLLSSEAFTYNFNRRTNCHYALSKCLLFINNHSTPLSEWKGEHSIIDHYARFPLAWFSGHSKVVPPPTLNLLVRKAKTRQIRFFLRYI
jgi:hypothetical protein